MKKYLLYLWCMALACMGVVSAADSSIEVPESVRALPATEAFSSAVNSARTSARKKLKKQVNSQKSKYLKENNFVDAELCERAQSDLMREFGGAEEVKGACFFEGHVWQDPAGSKFECKDGALVQLSNGKIHKIQIVNYDMVLVPAWGDLIVWFDERSAAIVSVKGLPQYSPISGTYKYGMVDEARPVAQDQPVEKDEPEKLTRIKETLRAQYRGEVAAKIGPSRKAYLKELRAHMRELGSRGKVKEASAVQQFVGKVEKIKDPLELAAIFGGKGKGVSRKLAFKGVYPEYQWQNGNNGKLDPDIRLVFSENGMECRGTGKHVWDRWELKGCSPGGNVLVYKELGKGKRDLILFEYGGYIHRVMTQNNTARPYVRRVYSSKPDSRKE